MSRMSANFLLLVAGLVWGGGFVAQATAMDDIGPFLFMTMRFFLATLAVLPLAILEHRKRGPEFAIQGRDWVLVLAVGFIFFSAMALQQVGLLATSVTNAGMLTGLYVVLVPIIAFTAFHEQQAAIIWPAALVAFVGIWLLGDGGLGALTWGDWLVILGAIFAALHVIAVGRAVTGLRRPVAVATAQFAVSGVLALAGFILARALQWDFEPAFSVTTITAAAPEILYAAFFAGALAFTLMAVCQQYTTAADAAILMSSESLFAALSGAILLNERLLPRGYAGCAMLFAAIVIVSVVSAKVEPTYSSS